MPLCHGCIPPIGAFQTDDDGIAAAIVTHRKVHVTKQVDRETGKLSDADYLELKARYTTQAILSMRAEGAAAQAGPLGQPADDEIETVVVRAFPRPASEIKTVVRDATEWKMADRPEQALPTLYGVPFERNRTRSVIIGLMGGALPTGFATIATSTIALFVPGVNVLGLAVSSVTSGGPSRRPIDTSNNKTPTPAIPRAHRHR